MLSQWLKFTHLCDFLLRYGFKVGRGEGEPTVSSRIVWEKDQWDVFLPLVAIAEVDAVHAHKPVRTWNDSHDKRQLELGQEEVEHWEVVEAWQKKIRVGGDEEVGQVIKREREGRREMLEMERIKPIVNSS